jgi:hypothetical protein
MSLESVEKLVASITLALAGAVATLTNSALLIWLPTPI